MRRQGVAILTLVAMAAFPAAAEPWRLDPAETSVRFSYEENGVEREGVFAEISARIDLDLDALPDARAEIMIHTASLKLGDALREGILATDPWLASASFETATFRLLDFSAIGSDLYLASGSLSIKGAERGVSAPIRVTVDGAKSVATGVIKIDRRDFGLRDAVVESFVEIGAVIEIMFVITAWRDPPGAEGGDQP